MGRSRYPRQGHRLAPATLRDLLTVPLPAQYAVGPNAELTLGDLDETAWARFDERACQSLADEVIRGVGRAVRMPVLIADRRLPAIPDGMRLTDLELEVRTINSLIAAGIHERPQDLSAMTIESILALRGFWVKSLVDLLTSLEHAIDHPEATARRNGEGGSPGSRPAGHYPRPGQRIAPTALRELLDFTIPEALVAGTPARGLRLCELDETAWCRLDAELIERLADLVVVRVNMSGCNRSIQQRRLPKPPKGLRLEDLRLENRTYNCLRKAGFGKRPEELGKRTIGDLVAIRAFGAKCLVDLLTALETLAARDGKLDEQLTAEAEALAALPESPCIYFTDPRLGPLLRAIDTAANTVAELAALVRRRRFDPADPSRLAHQLARVRERVEALRQQRLEEELTEIFAPDDGERDRQIAAEYYGWDGAGGRTLEELGRKHGLSRERVRQVCARAVRRGRGVQVFAPVLDRALEFIAARLPISLDKLQQQLREAQLTASRLPLEAIYEAARFLGRQPQFAVVAVGDAQLVVSPDCAETPRLAVQTARRAVLNYGATTLRDVAADLAAQLGREVEPALLLETLQTLKDFRWLDAPGGWFQLETFPQYGLPNTIDKVLAVAGRIDVAKLRGAIARYRRGGHNVPPARVLLEFCRRLPGVRVHGKLVSADPPRDWRETLSGVEAGMARVLNEHGPVMERSQFEERCVAEGMNRFSFNAIIMSSPVIVQYGRSIYGLIGAKVDRRTLRSLSARKPAGASSRVLCDFGHTADGHVYLSYRLSKAAIAGGVITVPAALKEQVHGQFALRTVDGQPAGTLVSKSGCAWGLGPVLRSHSAEPGDHLRITFDPCSRQAVIHLRQDAPKPALA